MNFFFMSELICKKMSKKKSCCPLCSLVGGECRVDLDKVLNEYENNLYIAESEQKAHPETAETANQNIDILDGALDQMRAQLSCDGRISMGTGNQRIYAKRQFSWSNICGDRPDTRQFVSKPKITQALKEIQKQISHYRLEQKKKKEGLNPEIANWLLERALLERILRPK